jgi:hypothetical protein
MVLMQPAPLTGAATLQAEHVAKSQVSYTASLAAVHAEPTPFLANIDSLLCSAALMSAKAGGAVHLQRC